MQAKGELSRSKQMTALLIWTLACWSACAFSWLLYKLGVHKQLANRLTEPFAHMTTLVTATEFENFFALRAHPDAQPEFQALADAMLRAYVASEPRTLEVGQWHLPFWREEDELKLVQKWGADGVSNMTHRVAICTARCARTSYVNFYGKDDFDTDVALAENLSKSGHWSPFEHCLRAERDPVRSGNVVGYTQYRHLFPNECRTLPNGPAGLLLQRQPKGDQRG